jgi:hypothetical protein
MAQPPLLNQGVSRSCPEASPITGEKLLLKTKHLLEQFLKRGALGGSAALSSFVLNVTAQAAPAEWDAHFDIIQSFFTLRFTSGIVSANPVEK